MADPLEARTAQLQTMGKSVFQIFQCADTEREHVLHLLDWLNPVQDARVLDVGCGVGGVAKVMQQVRPDLKFTLLNSSTYQLSVCPEGMEKVCADMHDTGLQGGTFDIIMVNYTFGHAEPDRALDEFFRLLAPYGELFLYDMEGYNPHIQHVLGYQTYTTAAMVSQAARHNFLLTTVGYPAGNTKAFDEVVALNPEHAEAVAAGLQGLRPVLWKFRKVL